MPSLLQPTKPLRCMTDHVICCCSHLQGCQVCIHKCGWRGSQMGRQGSWDAGVLSTGCKAKRRQADVNARIVGRRSSLHRLQGKKKANGAVPPAIRTHKAPGGGRRLGGEADHTHTEKRTSARTLAQPPKLGSCTPSSDRILQPSKRVHQP
jgi:hypothetical protein